MPKRAKAKTVSEVFAERVHAVRKSRGWTQQELANRLAELGAALHQTAVAKVENGTRKVSLDDAFLFATALEVSPTWLVTMPSGTDPVAVAPKVQCSPAVVRGWLRGAAPLPGHSARAFFSEAPDEVWDRMVTVGEFATYQGQVEADDTDGGQ